MNIIHHRRNTIEEIKSTPTRHGVEIDIRSDKDSVMVHHDPFSPGVPLKDWIKHYNHGMLVLNVKEEYLERPIMSIMETYSIENYFFLGQSIPSLVQWSQHGEKRCAVRVSEYEPVDAALLFANKLNWAWVEYFTEFPSTNDIFHKLANASFKIYLLSPELQRGGNPETEIKIMAKTIRQRKIPIDALCTKRPDLWEREKYT